ncbi:hypothetical protein HanXRQr2_Chr14g0642071 [Helianthus annuus]|uniref:Uncharacterized protein n=1 Tax=Helianthus annuus TaxID=4232 RepID=A0A9K3H7F8_HELAN|nr:hypothetical protein HanXRQr2_Chr14g0642071 [Helianthus annuus]KAJ0840207.1 hypothetical protein HanPSC8_Chr14g0615921 [Helianthus annuus]
MNHIDKLTNFNFFHTDINCNITIIMSSFSLKFQNTISHRTLLYPYRHTYIVSYKHMEGERYIHQVASSLSLFD